MPYYTITKAQCAQLRLPWHSLAWCMPMNARRVLRLQPGKLLRRRLKIS